MPEELSSDNILMRQTRYGPCLASAPRLMVCNYLASLLCDAVVFCSTTHLHLAQNNDSDNVQLVPYYLISALCTGSQWSWTHTDPVYDPFVGQMAASCHPPALLLPWTLLLPRGAGQQMTLNQFGQRPLTTFAIINMDARSRDTWMQRAPAVLYQRLWLYQTQQQISNLFTCLFCVKWQKYKIYGCNYQLRKSIRVEIQKPSFWTISKLWNLHATHSRFTQLETVASIHIYCQICVFWAPPPYYLYVHLLQL